MSTTVIITAGASAAFGPAGLVILLGAAALAFFPARPEQKDTPGTEKFIPSVSEIWQQTKQALIAEASEIISTHEREKIITSIIDSEALYKKSLADGDSSTAEQIVRSIREKIFIVHTDGLIMKAAAAKRTRH